MEEIILDIATAFGASALGQKFSLYLPNQDRDGQAVDQEKWVAEALHLFSELFGGATAFPQLVYSYVSAEAFTAGIQRLRQFMLDMGAGTNQGQVGFEFDGVFYLIDM